MKHIFRGLRWLGSWIYSALFRYRELYERRFDAILTAIELLLPIVGIAAFLAEIRSHIAPADIVLYWHDVTELIVYALILIFAFSRFLIALRRLWLGYRFNGLPRTPDGDFDVAGLLAAVRRVKWGEAPGAQPDGVERLQDIAARIADRSARMTSDGSLFSRDLRWAEREADALSEWFSIFPSALWQLPTAEGSSATELDGYFSVVVPITEASWRSIRHGMRATDLAELDQDAAAAITKNQGTRVAPYLARVRLLAYVHIFCEPDESFRVDEMRLIATSMQHIAFLLQRLFGCGTDFRRLWTFGFICESANSKQSRLLGQLGLNQFASQRLGAGDKLRGPATSAQGFSLFECIVTNGEPEGEATRASARRFLNTVEELVKHNIGNLTKSAGPS